MRICGKCGNAKPITKFYKQANCAGGYRPYCKECDKARNQKYRDANRERVREGDRNRYLGDRAEVMRANARKHYEQNHEHALNTRRAYYEQNREKWYEYRAAREARKTGVEHVPYTRREIYDRDGGVCAGCAKELPYAPHGFHIDHVIPLFHGGPDTPSNVQVMCPGCNRRKWISMPD